MASIHVELGKDFLHEVRLVDEQLLSASITMNGESNPTSTEISIGYPMDVRADPVGCPSWTSYGCLKDILMSSPVDVQLGISMDVQKTDVFGIS
jgi:hypothetical protein